MTVVRKASEPKGSPRHKAKASSSSQAEVRRVAEARVVTEARAAASQRREFSSKEQTVAAAVKALVIVVEREAKDAGKRENAAQVRSTFQ